MLEFVFEQDKEESAMPETKTVPPLTFSTLPWITGIDSLPDQEWLEHFPDGAKLLDQLPGSMNPVAIALIAAHLRLLARFALYGTDEDDGSSMVKIIEILDVAPVLEAEGQKFPDYLEEDIRKLRSKYPSLTETIDVFIQHVIADGNYYLDRDELREAQEFTNASQAH